MIPLAGGPRGEAGPSLHDAFRGTCTLGQRRRDLVKGPGMCQPVAFLVVYSSALPTFFALMPLSVKKKTKLFEPMSVIRRY